MMEKLRAERRQLLVLEPEADGLIQRVPAPFTGSIFVMKAQVSRLGDGLELVVGAHHAAHPLRR